MAEKTLGIIQFSVSKSLEVPKAPQCLEDLRCLFSQLLFGPGTV